MRSGVEPACYRAGVAGRVVSFMLTCLAFWCFLFISSFAYSLISSNAVYADCSAAMSIDGNVSLNVRANDGNITTDIVTVDTDCLNGYTLSISAPNDSNLYLNGDSSGSAAHISPTLGTMDSPTSIIGEGKYNTWGISMDNNTTVSSNTFFSIPNERIDIYSKDSPSEAGGDDIAIYYGASASYDLKAGTYTMANDGEITYYLVAHPGTTVYFDANGGTTPSFESKEVTPGQPYGELPTTARNDYTFLGWSRNPIPGEYQEVEYIESDGSQYINTNIAPSDSTGIYAILSSNDVSTDSVYFGSRKGSGDTRFWIANKDRQVYYGWNSNTFRQETIYTDSINRISLNYLNDRKMIFNDEIVKKIDNTLSSSNNLPIYLFATNIDNDASYKSKLRLYELKISANSNIIHDYIPCYKKDDGEIGLYDTIDNTFYENQGTGAFNKGSDVSYVTSQTLVSTDEIHTLYAIWGHNPTVTFNATGGSVNPSSKELTYNSDYGELPTPTKPGYNFVGWKTKNTDYTLPNEYQDVSYIESDGNQYINTGFITSDEAGVYAKLSSNNVSSDAVYFGSRKGGGATRFWIANKDRQVYYGWNSNTFRQETIYTTDINEVSINYLGDRKMLFNNNLVENINSTLNASNNLPIYIFAANNDNNASYKSSIKLYELRISANSDIKHDYIPCYRKNDGVIGLYDIVDGVFHANQGSRLFKKGRNEPNIFVAPSTQVITSADHTLYAIWEEN